MACSIINETGMDIPEESIKKCVEEAVRLHCSNKDADLSVVFVSRDKIRNLSREYYNKDKETDVLSFREEDGCYLGDVVVSPEYVADSKPENGLEWELCHVAVHGAFHVMGINHEDMKGGYAKVHKWEEEIIDKFIKRKS